MLIFGKVFLVLKAARMSPLTEAARSLDAPKDQGRQLQKRWVPRLCVGQAPASTGLWGTQAEVSAPATLSRVKSQLLISFPYGDLAFAREE